ncbi:MAG TPA: cyanophycin synthetase, partial [Patescibacteria group bacterium]|nr:cyanophycin synthetase [Patescibacteria group bacterium]
NVIKGIKHTLIVDDTYNASPKSSISALKFLERVKIAPGKRKWAVLGDMLELGVYTEEGHREVGKAMVDSGFNKLVTVGERAWNIAQAARDQGMKKGDVFHFSDNREAGKFVQSRIEQGDLIFIKGSQGARMEKIVKELMADPINAENLLVRQGEGWN